MVEAILGFLSSALIKSLVDKVLMFLAIKALLVAIFVVLVPVVINNVIHGFLDLALSYVNQVTGDMSEFNGVMQFVGLGAWLINVTRIPECISMIVSALQLHLILKMIPFSPVK